MNPLKPELMTAGERIAELGEILARGLVRVRARQSSQLSGDHGESCLHFAADQRGHATPNLGGKA